MTRRVGLLSVIALVLAAASAAVTLLRQEPGRSARDGRRIEDLPADPRAIPAELAAVLAGEDPGRAAGLQSMRELPARLPMPAGGKLLSAWRQGEGAGAEELAVCAIPGGDPAAILQSTVAAAESSGYTIRTTSSPDSRLLAAAGKTLLIRCRRADEETRLTVILRYTMPIR